MIVLKLALKSLWNRRIVAALAVLSIAMSVVLLLGVERVRTGARQSFADTISGTDLIVGARTGTVQLLLYAVFRIGNATNNITWASYQEIARQPEVAWSVPIALGDSHRGFRVLGTTADYFTHYRYRRAVPLAFREGRAFDDLYDLVIGADVAAALGYKVGDKVVIAHGLGSVSFVEHDDKPFRVSGILAKTGTPVDRTVHVSLGAIEAIHLDWQSGARVPGSGLTADAVRQMDLTPKAITAALIGLKSRLSTFKLQRAINDYPREPLTAILPGAALQELWGLVGVAETALTAVSAMVVLAALLGMMTMILATLEERRREMAILRSVGARPLTIMGLLLSESVLLTTLGIGLGVIAAGLAVMALRPYMDQMYGIDLPQVWPGLDDWAKLGAIGLAGVVAGAVPAIRAYRLSLADGLTVRM